MAQFNIKILVNSHYSLLSVLSEPISPYGQTGQGNDNDEDQEEEDDDDSIVSTSTTTVTTTLLLLLLLLLKTRWISLI